MPAGIVCAVMVGAIPALAGDTAETIGGTLRLIPGPVSGGVAHMGLAIDLKPGWHTYWRYPGDSGVPPDISSNGSTNVSSLTVDYPAPMRFGDASDQTIGYQGSVVLPLTVQLNDPKTSASISVHARLGICRDICVPVDETLDQMIDPATPPDKADVATLSNADAKVPQPVKAGVNLSVTGIKRDTTVKPEMVTFMVKGPSGQLDDVFVEGPEGWALPLPSRVAGTGDESTWSFALDGLPSGTDPKNAKLTFTLVGKAASATQSIQLQ